MRDPGNTGETGRDVEDRTARDRGVEGQILSPRPSSSQSLGNPHNPHRHDRRWSVMIGGLPPSLALQLKHIDFKPVAVNVDGNRAMVRGFRRMWRVLFRLAGLDFGRDKGLTWHTSGTSSSRAPSRTQGIRWSLKSSPGTRTVGRPSVTCTRVTRTCWPRPATHRR